MKSGIFIWTLIVIVVLFFFHLLPLPIRNEYSVTWALLGGLVCFTLLLFFFSTREEDSKVLVFQFPLYFASIFLFGGLLLFFTSKNVEYQFEHNYAISKGRLFLNENTEPKLDAETKAHIDYDIPGHRKRYLSVYVTWRQFDLQVFNSEVPIVYSKDYPDLAKMVLSEKDRRKYGIDFTDTLNDKQQRMMRSLPTYLTYFNRDYQDIVSHFKRRGLSNEEIYGVLLHVEPNLSISKAGSGKWFRGFATVLSAIFLIIKLYSKFKN